MKITMINNTKENQDNIALLKLIYPKITNIFKTILGEDLIIADENLNYYYVKLCLITEEVLKKNDFLELAKDAPELPESIIGDFKSLEAHLETYLRLLNEFYGKIEKEYILQNISNYQAPEEVEKLFSEMEVAIEKYIKNNKQQTKLLDDKNLAFAEKIKASFNNSSSSKKDKEYIFEWYQTNDKLAHLIIKGEIKLEFTGEKIISLLNFLHKRRGSDWIDYNEIKNNTAIDNTEFIRHTVDDINKRVSSATKNEIKELIMSKPINKSPKSPKLYRWI